MCVAGGLEGAVCAQPLLDEHGYALGPHRVWLSNMMLPVGDARVSGKDINQQQETCGKISGLDCGEIFQIDLIRMFLKLCAVRGPQVRAGPFCARERPFCGKDRCRSQSGAAVLRCVECRWRSGGRCTPRAMI